MFGKPQWFRERKGVLRLTPICWQGWLCWLIWAAIAILPFLLLLAAEKGPEACIWMAATAGFGVWEMRQILAQKRGVATNENVLYIGDDADDSHVATRNYDLNLRD